jgi:catechol 2,3-dioxygenase-like lactoylglutathione lyase family enzyme
MAMGIDVDGLRKARPPTGLPFRIGKIGHVVIRVSDMRRSVDFYTQVLGFQVSDVYPETMMPGGMVFLRCNPDHHCLALIGGGEASDTDLHHIAFEVPSIDDVFRARDHLRAHHAQIDFEGRRRAGCQVAVEFRDPDGHRLEIYWGVDQVGSDGHVRASNDWRQKFSLEEAVEDAPPGQDTTLHDPTLRR